MIRHFPRRSSASYIISTNRHDEHNHWWTQHQFTFVRNKSYGPTEDEVKKIAEYRVEWAMLRKRTNGKFSNGFGLGFEIRRGTGLHVSLYFGKLLSIWFTWHSARIQKIVSVKKTRDPKYFWEGRVYHFSIFDGSGSWFRICLGTLPNHWGRDTPGIEWSSSNLARKIYGYKRSEMEELRAGVKVHIPLDNGYYLGLATLKKSTWSYTYPIGKLVNWIWRPKPNVYWDIDIPGGIPVEGKGENAHDCGMDGLFGIGADENDTSKIMAEKIINHVLHDRDRYGGPHRLPRPMTVQEASEWKSDVS